MASSGKKKTTMAKLSRESRLRERRLDKKAKKDARKLAAQQPGQPSDTLTSDDQGVDGSGVGQADPDAVVEALGEN